jgi:hypothetical protein
LLIPSQAPVPWAHYPSYSGGRDQEDRGSRPAWANTSQDPSSEKNLMQKQKQLVEWLKV